MAKRHENEKKNNKRTHPSFSACEREESPKKKKSRAFHFSFFLMDFLSHRRACVLFFILFMNNVRVEYQKHALREYQKVNTKVVRLRRRRNGEQWTGVSRGRFTGYL